MNSLESFLLHVANFLQIVWSVLYLFFQNWTGNYVLPRTGDYSVPYRIIPNLITKLFKLTICCCIEYCSKIWTAGLELQIINCIDLLSRIQHRIGNIVEYLHSKLDSLSHCHNVASLSLLYKYFQF